MSAAHQSIMDTFQPHFYDQSDERESSTPSMCFHYNVNGQCSVTSVALCTILHQTKSTVCRCMTCAFLPASAILIISITIMLFGCVLLPLAFRCVPLPVCYSSQSRCFPAHSSRGGRTQPAINAAGARHCIVLRLDNDRCEFGEGG